MNGFKKLKIKIILSILNLAIWPLVSHAGMVVTEQHLASKVGARILQAGGNAVDAAVAVGYALAVVDPCCGNIGGGGFMTLRLKNGTTTFINFRERAPMRANSKLFLDEEGKLLPDQSIEGYLAVATPGTVLGLETMLKKYGTMKREELIAPAIELAKKGFTLTPGDIKILNENHDFFTKDPNVAAIFLNHDEPFQVGDRLIQSDLAKTLQLISNKGPGVFYRGEIAKTIVAESQKNEGILSLKDFRKYQVSELRPLQCEYRGYTIITAPLPSSGGRTLCEMLHELEIYPLGALGFHSAHSTRHILEAMRKAYAHRNQLGDPSFVSNPPLFMNHESTQTTHYSIVDQFGNAVSLTYTLNGFFGAKIIADHTGFFLNNEMDDFTIKLGEKNQFGLVQGKNNLIEPGKQPLSSMTPTIVTKDNQLVMVLGSPGGPKIISSVLETILNVIDYKMNIQDAVNAPRFHFQGIPNVVEMEPKTFTQNTIQRLESMGYHFSAKKPWGAVEAIYLDHNLDEMVGANDRRRSAGLAVGENSN